jgi:cytochrome c556
MSKTSALVAIGALALFAAGALAQSSPALHTRQAMIEGVNPAAVAIWDVTNSAIDEEGALDPALMTAQNWGRIEDGATRLEAAALHMAIAQTLVADGPANLRSEDLPPGTASREEIQAMIDADPEGFRAVARAMAERAAALVAAARLRNVVAVGDLAAGLDQDCTSCHTRYWYLQAE